MYKIIVGLEIHAELKTQSKMFCSCSNDRNEKIPNFNICPVCMGHPGTLPTINEEAIKKVIKTGLALNCSVSTFSKFDRKNYFYPDLPKGYQISQHDMPLCQKGYLEINGRKIRIRRVHLEEDTGKLIHSRTREYSLVDFNRAGVPLMELVTEPDIVSAKEARNFAQELQLILRYLEVSEADMEKGQMRVEVNISMSADKKLGTKVEIKNLNSFRVVERAIGYEIKRQRKILESGKKILQETRGWHDQKAITLSQREKEEAHDYRYFSEPDLPSFYFPKEFIEEIKSKIPELPFQRKKRFKRKYNLSDKETEIFIYNKGLGEYFEKIISKFGPSPEQELIKLAANYLISDLQGLLKGSSIRDKNFLILPENFAQFIALIHKGEISSKIAKMILEEMFLKGTGPSFIIKEKKLIQIVDKNKIKKIIQETIKSNPKVIQDYEKGKKNAFQFLVGQIMAKTQGKADPQLVNKILKETLIK